jgi:hypothetical protein
MLQENNNGQRKYTLQRISRDLQLLELGERGIEGFLDELPRLIREANQGCHQVLPLRRRPPLRRQKQPP